VTHNSLEHLTLYKNRKVKLSAIPGVSGVSPSGVSGCAGGWLFPHAANENTMANTKTNDKNFFITFLL
jgi:hypothetical protein